MKKLAIWTLAITLTHLMIALPGWACCGASIGPIADDTANNNNKGCADEKCKPCPPPKTGSPVFLKSGNYRYEQTDLVLTGRGPLIEVSRVYNSQDRYIGAVGKGWHHSLIIQLFRTTGENGQAALLRMPNAGRINFIKNGSTYTPPLGHKESLAEEPDHSFTFTRPNGDVWKFNPDGWIDRIEDRNGNAVIFTYSDVNGQMRPTGVQGAGNQHLTISWNGAGRIHSITDQANRTITYNYDQDGNLETFQDAVGRYWTYTYSTNGPLLRLEKVELQVITYASATYDSLDRAIGYMENGQSVTLEYRTDRTIKRDASGNEWLYFYDDQGGITKRIDPLGNTHQYFYNTDYTLASEIEEDGGEWNYTYAGMGRVGQITRHVGENSWTWTITYDTTWPYNPAKILGPAGWGGSVFHYDNKGNLSEVRRIQRDNTTEESLYTIERNNGFGDVTSVVDVMGARSEYDYDNSGRLIHFRLPPNNSQGTMAQYTLGYDSADRVNSLTDSLNRATTTVYDALNRAVQLTLPDPGTGATGFVYQWSYPPTPSDGKFSGTATDFNGVVTTSTEDVWGHPVKVIDGAGNDIQLTWSDGLPVEFVDAEKNTTTYTFDKLRRLTKILHPENTFTEFTFKPTGQVATRKDRKLQTVTFGYDDLGRITNRQYPEGTIAYEYTGPVVTTVRDNAEGGGEKVTSYEHDADFRLTRVTNDRGVIEYSWLPGDFLSGYRVDGGAWVNYGYYQSGDLHTILRADDANPFEYTYLPSGARAALQMSNGSHVNYTWDNLDRLLTLTNLDPANSLISRYSYEYDRDWTSSQFTRKGLRDAMTEDLPAGSTGTEKYYFDSLYQLNRTDYPDGSNHQWTYDRIGNRLSAAVNVPGQDPVIHNYTYFPNGHSGNSQRLQSDGINTYTWDNNGNMATKVTPSGTSYYGWNSRNMLTTITAPTLQASYRYDFMSRRTGKTVSSTDSAYQYTALDLVKETTGGTASEYVFGADIDEILNARIGSTEYFYASDALGSVRQVVDVAGQLKNKYGYDVWGETHTLSATIPNTFLFTGRKASEDSLFDYRMRHYDASLGRFISEDPLRLGAGDASFYRYVYGNPVNLVDPVGLMGLEDLPDSVLDVLADTPESATSFLQDAGNFAAGFGDSLSFGITGMISSGLGDQGSINPCSAAYEGGGYTEIGLELLASMGGSSLRSAAKSASRGAVRAEAAEMTKNIARESEQFLHHVNPLFGHPGGAGAVFPTGGLSSVIHSGNWNIKALESANHLAAHRGLRALEKWFPKLVNPATTGLRYIRNGLAREQCDCQ